MKYYAKPLGKLIGELSKLPGIGGKTAQRLAFHILSLTDSEAEALANAITEAKHTMKYCSICGNLTDTDPCAICQDTARSKNTICVVESPKDVHGARPGVSGRVSCAARCHIADGRYWS